MSLLYGHGGGFGTESLQGLSAFLHRGNALVTHTTGPMALARAVWERLKTVAQRLLKQDSVELQEAW